MRRLTVLLVAYPFAPVGPDAVGGAEQILSSLDAALVAAGHRSIVLACAGSQARGQMAATAAPDDLGAEARASAQAAYARSVADAVTRWHPDLVHMHGIDFHAYLPPPGPPVLATLHLPPAWYPAEALRPSRPRTWVHAVSRSQDAACPASPRLLPPIGNGVPLEALRTRVTRRDFALCLGRICPEKNQAAALEAGELAKTQVLLGGSVFAYPEHQRYWREMLLPRLGGRHRFLGAVGLARKRRLLGAARCLLVPSVAPETSSLVAMEAMACGTPVIAFASGALPEIVEDGVTGHIVRDAREMALAMRAIRRIDPEACRERARRHFDAKLMQSAYLDRYQALARSPEWRDAA